MANVREEQLVKALSQMEAIAKGDPKGKLPKTTDQANGGLSTEGNAGEMSAGGEPNLTGIGKAMTGGKKKTFAQWAKEEESESEHSAEKAMDDEELDMLKAADKDADDSEDESSSEDEPADESSSEDEEMSKGSKCAKKSLARKSTIADIIKSDSTTGPVVDVSPFIEQLVDQVSDAVQELRKAVDTIRAEQTSYNRAFSKALVASGNLALDINKKIENLGNSPASVRKSVLSKSEIHERFDDDDDATVNLSKSQVLDAMVELAKAGSVTALDVTRYEATNSMEPTVLKAVTEFLKKSA